LNLIILQKIFTKPREEFKKFDFTPFKEKKKHEWSIENSIFNNYEGDH
jgi:hypothetical protein